MDVCYSDSDIRTMLRGNVKIMTYKDLTNYPTIEKALEEFGRIALLYETKDNFGHWCCVFYGPKNRIYFFDPYGIRIDDQLLYIDPKFRMKNNQDFRYLSYLLKNTDKKIDYNDYSLQSEKEGVNTCGRWVVVRMMFNFLDSDEFAKLFSPDSNLSSDDLVLAYTKQYKGKLRELFGDRI